MERAVFVLREVFDYPYRDIARTVHCSPDTARQTARRARAHVRAQRPRRSVDRTTHWQVTERFLAACRGGDVAALLHMLAPEATLRTDGGGRVRSARYPIRGADRVARFLAGIQRRGTFSGGRYRFVLLNGEPGAVFYHDGVVEHALCLALSADGVDRVFVTANPEKLRTAARTEEEQHA